MELQASTKPCRSGCPLIKPEIAALAIFTATRSSSEAPPPARMQAKEALTSASRSGTEATDTWRAGLTAVAMKVSIALVGLPSWTKLARTYCWRRVESKAKMASIFFGFRRYTSVCLMSTCNASSAFSPRNSRVVSSRAAWCLYAKRMQTRTIPFGFVSCKQVEHTARPAAGTLDSWSRQNQI